MTLVFTFVSTWRRARQECADKCVCRQLLTFIFFRPEKNRDMQRIGGASETQRKTRARPSSQRKERCQVQQIPVISVRAPGALTSKICVTSANFEVSLAQCVGSVRALGALTHVCKSPRGSYVFGL